MLLTGRHHYRTGVIGVHGGQDFVNLNESLLPQRLRAAGYHTGHVGKWHSGKSEGYLPWQRGFDASTMARLYVYQNNPVLRNGTQTVTDGWTEERLADAAIDFISSKRTRPFFLYYCPLTPHAGYRSLSDQGKMPESWYAPDEWVKPYRDRGLRDEFARLYGAISFADAQIGRVLASLDALGLTENTLVIFLSDNGPVRLRLNDEEWAARNPSGLRGKKEEVDENGIRTFCFMRWPGHIASGHIQAVSWICDLFPTLLDIAGAPPSRVHLDGVSLAPLLRGEASSLASRTLFWTDLPGAAALPPSQLLRRDAAGRVDPDQPLLTLSNLSNRFVHTRAVRRGDLKLTRDELFDMSTPGGRREAQPLDEIVAKRELVSEFADWWAGVLREPHAFSRPLVFITEANFPVDRMLEEKGSFFAYECFVASPGVTVHDHFVGGFIAPQASLGFHVASRAAATYQPKLRFRGSVTAGALAVRLTIYDAEGNLLGSAQGESDGGPEIPLSILRAPVIREDQGARLVIEVTHSSLPIDATADPRFWFVAFHRASQGDSTMIRAGKPQQSLVP